MINTAVRILPLTLPNASNIQVDMLMLNELHPLISGNKYFKLVHNLTQAKVNNATTLVSMGGAYSNHLVALAVAGKQAGFRTKAYIRGEMPAVLNTHLQVCVANNMELHYVSRAEYSNLRNTDTALTPNEYWIPEGGGNALGAQGCELITKFTTSTTPHYTMTHYNFNAHDSAAVNSLFTTNYYNYCVCACGTGTTLAGIITALQHTQVHTLGIQVLKGENYLSNELLTKHTIAPNNLWSINDKFHCGGYAKTPNYLASFIQQQTALHNVPLEPVYTGKMLYAVTQLLANNKFHPNSRILLLHSGGMQSKRI